MCVQTVYTPLCNKLHKVISVLECVLLCVLMIDILLSMFNIPEESFWIFTASFYVLVNIAKGVVLIYISKNVRIVYKQYLWFDRLQEMCDCVNKQSRLNYKWILKNINEDYRLYQDAEKNKHIRNLKSRAVWSFVLAVLIILLLFQSLV